MSDDFVLAVHTVTHQLQRVPRHFIDELPYFEAVSDSQVASANSNPKKAVEKPVTKEGAK